MSATHVHMQAARVALDGARRQVGRDDRYTHQTLATIAVAEGLLALVELLEPLGPLALLLPRTTAEVVAEVERLRAQVTP